jgi:hypothetical protein
MLLQLLVGEKCLRGWRIGRSGVERRSTKICSGPCEKRQDVCGDMALLMPLPPLLEDALEAFNF